MNRRQSLRVEGVFGELTFVTFAQRELGVRVIAEERLAKVTRKKVHSGSNINSANATDCRRQRLHFNGVYATLF